MGWKGKFFGALIGLLVTRGSVWGAIVGALIGQLFDQSVSYGFSGNAHATGPDPSSGGPGRGSIANVFFSTTFEFMGHVAKSDGRVSEAEIDAARRLMQELRLGPNEVAAAISSFRMGKSPSYDAVSGVETLRGACAMRHDLLRAFMELQLRAALAGNGLSPPAHAILSRTAARLGMSALEFAHMEASLRSRRQGYAGQAGTGRPVEKPLSECYTELEISADAADQEVTKAYRRQMSRHHPDKLVANGLPESMALLAKEKTQRIQEAYEAIRTARGMR